MIISKKCNLILSSLFDYDISKCSYSILESIGWNINNINRDNKKIRNIEIGLLMRDNPKLSEFLLSQTEKIIDNYISLNKIGNDDIIIRAKDGFISKKPLTITDNTLKLESRGIVSKLIINQERNKYLAIYSNGQVVVKGINKTLDTSFFDLFKNLEFGSKKNLMIGLENIRKIILDSDNVKWFIRKDQDEIYIPILNQGFVKLNSSLISLIDTDEIDKIFVWEEFIWPFIKSILIHYYA